MSPASRLILASLLLFLLPCTATQASLRSARSIPASGPESAAVRVVTSTGSGQAGYVHYFVLTHPDGTLEDHVGIELEDRRIAWSFPGAGVMVSPFIASGSLDIGGEVFRVEHRYGLRPFPGLREMQALRSRVARRVAFWIDQETPYCTFRQPGGPYCLNCGDFVAHILFPGLTPGTLDLPKELARVARSSPDDLLLYMLGLYQVPDTGTRLARLERLNIPVSLRNDVFEMLRAEVPALAVAPRPATAPKPPPSMVIRSTQRKAL